MKALKSVKYFYNKHCRIFKHFNESWDNLPKQSIQKVAQVLLAIFMYFTAFMLLIAVVLPSYTLNSTYTSLQPYTFYFLDQLSSIVFAFVFMSLARGIISKVKKAFIPTGIVIVLGAMNSLWKQNFPKATCAISLVVLICWWLSRGALTRDKLSYSWGQTIMDGIIFLASFICYVAMGIKTYYHDLFQHFPNPYMIPSRRLWMSGFLGIIIAALVVIIIYRYLSYCPVDWIDRPFTNQLATRAKNVIKKFGGNEISHLAFMQDKHFYFYSKNHQDQVFFMFRKESNKLVVMGEPIGNHKYFAQATDAFMNDANKLGLSLVFYEVGKNYTMLLHTRGFDFTKFGEEGFVDLPNFNLVGSKHRGDRALIHKFQRNHYQFQIINPPFDDKFLNTLKQISDNWLDGDSEKGFSLGYFNKYYLSQAPIAIMKTAKGKIISFASLMPEGNHNVASIDLMRSSKSAPSGIMDGIFINLFKKFQKDGYQVFNLGMAPLANVGVSKFSFMNERFAHLIFEYGSKFYSFQGLRSYKNKFVSIWKPRYIVYRKSGSLIFTMFQLIKLVNKKISKDTTDLKPVDDKPKQSSKAKDHNKQTAKN